MTAVDWVVIAAYFGLLLALTWWSIKNSQDTTDDYFLAGRNLGWVLVGSSIYASNIESKHLVGLAGSGATSGVALAHYELHAWCLLVLGWMLVPFYIRSRVYTMPEFLERRFSAASRWVLSLISLVAYILTKMAVGIFAGGVVFGTLLPELRLELGGTVFNSFWIGSVLVVVLTGLWYWCTDQYIVQRTLGAPDERHARRGTIFAAFLKLLPVFIFIIPGIIALALARTGRVPGLEGMVDATGRVVPSVAQAAFPLLVQ